MKRISFRIDEKEWERLLKKYGEGNNQKTMENILRRLKTLEVNQALRRSKIKRKLGIK